MSLRHVTVVIILIAANALYVAAEFAAVGVRRSRVRRMAEDGGWLAKRLLPHVEGPVALDRYVGASQIGITLSSLVLGAYGQATFGRTLIPIIEATFGVSPVTALSISAAAILVVLTALQLVLGELVPKALALQYPTGTALATVLPMEWSLAVFNPLIWLLNGSALLFLRLFGGGSQTHRHLHSPEEIDLLIAESRDGGLLEPVEQQRLRSALHLGTRTARDLMVPIDRVTMLDVTTGWDEVLEVVLRSPYSRLPVCATRRDNVVGIVRVKDIVERYAAEGPRPIARLTRPAIQIPPDRPADAALADLRAHRAHSAIVTDGGRAIGLLTVQDVLSELLAVRPAQSARRGRS